MLNTILLSITQASLMAILKQFVSDSYFFSIILEHFVLINMRKLEYIYYCAVARLITFQFIFFAFV